MSKESRLYSVLKRVDGADRLVEIVSVEETYSRDRALDLAVERLPESDREGDYAAIVGVQWKPWGRQLVELTGWGAAQAAKPTPRDSNGNAPIPGQTDLVEAVDGEPIPEAEVAVEPIPHVVTSEDPALAAPLVEDEPPIVNETEREVTRDEQLAADRARAAQEEAEVPSPVADGIAAVQARRKAAAAAKRDEPPAPVNPPAEGFSAPADW